MADPVKSSTVAKSGFALGILAFVSTWWPTISAMLASGGVSPDAIKKVDTVIKIAEDNKDRLDQLEQAFEAWKAKPPVVATPPVQVTPTPIVSPEIQALQDQIKALKDLLEKQNQQPPPIQIQPQPIQPPPPVVPSDIKAVDSHGKPITGSVDPGQQFFISSTATGGTWTIIKSAEQDVDTKVYQDEVSCVLRNDAVLTVVHSSGQPITTSSLIIKCNKGAQPPPVVNVDPVKPPSGSRKFNVYVVEDPSVKRSAVTANILSNLTTRKLFTDKGCEIVPVFTATDPAAVYAKQQQAPLPAVVLFDTSSKQFVKAAPLPTDLGLSLMSSMGG